MLLCADDNDNVDDYADDDDDVCFFIFYFYFFIGMTVYVYTVLIRCVVVLRRRGIFLRQILILI